MTPFDNLPDAAIWHVQLQDARIKWVFADSYMGARCGAAQAWGGDNIFAVKPLPNRTRDQDFGALTRKEYVHADLRTGDFAIDLVVLP